MGVPQFRPGHLLAASLEQIEALLRRQLSVAVGIQKTHPAGESCPSPAAAIVSFRHGYAVRSAPTVLAQPALDGIWVAHSNRYQLFKLYNLSKYWSIS